MHTHGLIFLSYQARTLLTVVRLQYCHVSIHDGAPTRLFRSSIRPVAFGTLQLVQVLVRLESARNVRAADTMGTSDPFVKVGVGFP